LGEEDISRFAGGSGFCGRESSWRITGDKVTVWIGTGSRVVKQMEVGRSTALLSWVCRLYARQCKIQQNRCLVFAKGLELSFVCNSA